ncbi:MAG: ATP-binding protein [Sphingobacteriales bacterium JAD_PAG50586_3]|nr:MAG: ATP-binding protein [Sphingobacteriales bacterium JAD_PAG50586_3]
MFKKALKYLPFGSRGSYFDTISADDIISQQRYNLFRFFSMAGALISLLVAAQAADTFNVPLLGAVLVATAIAYVINYYALNKTQNTVTAYAISIFLTFTTTHILTYYSGGLVSSNMFYLGATILCCYMLLGSKAGNITTVLFIFSIAYFYILGETTEGIIQNLLVPSIADQQYMVKGIPAEIKQDFLVTGILSLFFIGVLANYLESKKNIVIERITESRDILAAKNIELEKLSIVASKTDNGVFITDKNGTVEYSNDGLTRLVGYTSAEVDGQKPWDVFNGVETDTVETERLQNSISEGQSFSGEFRHKHKDGHYTWIGVTATPIADEDGKVSRYVFINSEINERKIAEEKMRLYTENLEKAFKELDKFAYVVSHDLKAPLRAIFNLSTWISEDYGDQMPTEAREMFDRIRGRVLRMESLIEGILAYSKIDRKDDVFVDVDLNKQLKDSLDLIDVPKDFKIDIQAELPIVKGDQSKIHQVFMNLLSNAIKFNERPEGEGFVKVNCEDDGAFWKFSVQDNGPGIEPQYHEKIFVIFQTLNARDTFESTGVGLAIVKKIVDEMGGKIWLESELGQGTTFFFTMAKDPAAHRKTFLVAA